MNYLAVGYDVAGCFEVERYPQSTGEIVGGTQGEEAQHRVTVCQEVHYRAHRPVPAPENDEVVTLQQYLPDRLRQAGRISQGVNGVYRYPISGQTVERQAEGRLPDSRAHVHYEGGATEVRPLERGPPGSAIESVYSSFAGARDCGLFDHRS